MKNRRSFLSFLFDAPVALPMAAKAIAAKTQPVLVEGIAGELEAGFISPNEARAVYGMTDAELDALRGGDPFVAAQFDADLDLIFDRSPHLRDTHEPQAHVSPDNKTEEVTA
jgi:hypothetical protein